MGICRNCNFYTNGICPSGNPWRARCILDDEEFMMAKTIVHGPNKEIDNTLEKNIVESIRNGFSYEQLTKKYGITKYRATEIKRKHGLLRKDKPKKKTVKAKPVEQKTKDATFIFKAEGKKPHKACYPSEKDGCLVWAIDIHSVDELLEVADSFKNKALVIRKRELDVIDIKE